MTSDISGHFLELSSSPRTSIFYHTARLLLPGGAGPLGCELGPLTCRAGQDGAHEARLSRHFAFYHCVIGRGHQASTFSFSSLLRAQGPVFQAWAGSGRAVPAQLQPIVALAQCPTCKCHSPQATPSPLSPCPGRHSPPAILQSPMRGPAQVCTQDLVQMTRMWGGGSHTLGRGLRGCPWAPVPSPLPHGAHMPPAGGISSFSAHGWGLAARLVPGARRPSVRERARACFRLQSALPAASFGLYCCAER